MYFVVVTFRSTVNKNEYTCRYKHQVETNKKHTFCNKAQTLITPSWHTSCSSSSSQVFFKKLTVALLASLKKSLENVLSWQHFFSASIRIFTCMRWLKVSTFIEVLVSFAFFLTIENTLSLSALEWGIVNIALATFVRVGYLKFPSQFTSLPIQPQAFPMSRTFSRSSTSRSILYLWDDKISQKCESQCKN